MVMVDSSPATVSPEQLTTDDGVAYRAYHDMTHPGSLSITVMQAVGAVVDVDPMELDSLYEAVDPDALDELFCPGPDGQPSIDGRIRFRFAGCRVTVESNGTILVEP
ncbi:HalOD1 output domain-containing protein [Halomarina pelagica]|uniref:HalOD1 output domain-containing protein n=1 Tax=Halomarina pelagica TaxID=2961599 RepID=UPI0020C46BBB|nr:HalOD1 output domain-containing protein [Halomarina sp. BND7]